MQLRDCKEIARTKRLGFFKLLIIRSSWPGNAAR